MKLKKLFIISTLTIPIFAFFVPKTNSYFSDTMVLKDNIISTGFWEEEPEELIVELKLPLDEHKYFLGQTIQILWKVHNAHPHSEFDFNLFLLDEEGNLIQELDLDELECGPPEKAPVYEKWCKWTPTEIGTYKIKVEAKNSGGEIGSDENEKSFLIEEKPKKNT